MGEARRLYIGGQWVATAHAQQIRSPYDDRVAAEICLGNEAEMDRAIAAAYDARSALRSITNAERGDALDHVSRRLAQRREELARTLTAESGKPIKDARLEVDRAVHTFQIASEEARRFGAGETIPLDRVRSSAGRFGYTRRFPAGVVGAITPFNFPLNLVAHKVAPALAAACPVVLKPAHQTPLTALNLAEIVAETALPGGAFNVVHTAPSLGTMLATDDRVAVLSFTGSGRVGWDLKAKAIRKKVILELGGNAAVVVDETSDLDHAAVRCAAGGYAYAGQVCISVQRIFVHESVYDRFAERFCAEVEKLVVGDPDDETTTVGPMISADAAARVSDWTREAIARGARLRVGDAQADGRWLRPIVLEGVPAGAKVDCEEVFGPVVTLTPYADFDDALERVNRSPFGLQAGVFTKDVARVPTAWDRLDVGAVIVNDVPTYRVDHMPYGGVKGSGFGREGVKYAIEEMSEPRLLVE